jgi:DNA polymerase I-like protein with 3'-5' exonuclease and polymerase domains
MLIFDNETNGLIPELDRIHCIAMRDTNKGETHRANDHGSKLSIEGGVRMLQEAADICGHNIIGFDIPATQKVYPWFVPKGRVWDTLIMSQLIFTNLTDDDFDRIRQHERDIAAGRRIAGIFPKKLIGKHSLEAWGWRMGLWKGDYSDMMKAKGLDPWESWNQEMDDYCVQDIRVTTKLYDKLMAQGFSEESIRLEHDIAPILRRQEAYGFLFDKEKGLELEATLVGLRAELVEKLRAVFPPWQAKAGILIPKRDNKAKGYFTGVPFQKWKTVTFNPGSRQHIAGRLTALYGWKPTEFTNDGKPKMDETTLEGLKYPEIPLLIEYLTVEKRLGQLSEGKQAWFKAVKADGRIHGRVNQNGAVTGRMTHSNPNMAQVPSSGSLYGPECRALFMVPKGKKLVGADASGLELRCLAHFMGRWDAGAYAKVILEGDVHTTNMLAAGLSDRNQAKTFIYAFLYGAGDAKIGSIVGGGAKRGAELKAQFLKGLPALAALIKAIQTACREKGYLKGLDGRKLHVRSPHAALNTLLQGAGAIVMKKALVLLDRRLQEMGLNPGTDYEFVGNIHDEWQIEVSEEHADAVGAAATDAIFRAGEHFGFRCPLAGEFKVGNNWHDTH